MKTQKEIETLNSPELTAGLNECFEQYRDEFTLNDIKNWIQGNSQERHSMWENFAPFSAIMQLAASKGHFTEDIIWGAMNGRRVSEKQAWCVAFFAKKHTCIIK